jgi:hypothetical protein
VGWGNNSSGENFTTGSLIICTAEPISQYFFREKMEKNEMSGACSTYGSEESCIQGFGGET